MARLKQLKPQVRNVGLAVKMVAPREQRWSQQAETPDDRSFYHTRRWRDLRWQVFERDLFTCQWQGCGLVFSDTSLLVCDHIVPVRVKPEGKWDEANLQCLCKTCHDGPKQAFENATYGHHAHSWKGRGGVKAPTPSA
jgi:5-methylcytosine-specific restriction enzyme A